MMDGRVGKDLFPVREAWKAMQKKAQEMAVWLLLRARETLIMRNWI